MWLIQEALCFHSMVSQWDARHHSRLQGIAAGDWQVVREAAHRLLAMLPVVVTDLGEFWREPDTDDE